jgi:hypothetical protein
MAKKKATDPNKSAHDEAEKDILGDPELSDSDPTDDLDEGELANRDNSDEDAFDGLEKKRPAPHHHPDSQHHPAQPPHPEHHPAKPGHPEGQHHSGKGSEK